VNPIKNKKDLETTVDEIRSWSFSYLEKYSASKQQLKTHLLKKMLKKSHKSVNRREIHNLIDVVISSLEKKKIISDKYYSDYKSKVFYKRGYSLNKIRYNLIAKGINQNYIKDSISKIKEQESNPDFFSAIRLCKKRRIGPSRDESNRSLFFKKDISILARAGFSYDISKKILDIPKDEFLKLCKMI